ncbi:expressed unknown protein [Seminavis robusta]|uniref:Uncharacterized protein n=1 Tax=Seminavis robusta TaxID=568900 RepID=A0A9N8DF21_9STRA|nr:expressed unknown protein [Seminavis robusta]|eukprot:Sro118_g057900.1 n/a (397) ;mRNA; f:102401-103591
MTRQSQQQHQAPPSRWILLPMLACVLSPLAESSMFGNRQRFASKRQPMVSASSLHVLDLRGGSTTVATAKEDDEKKEEEEKPSSSSLMTDKYRMQQMVLLQSRSARLRQELVDRGVLTDVPTGDTSTTAEPVDWDCALSTPRHPKRCLYSYDAQEYTKVVAPIGSSDWIGLATMNRLRRTDPSKLEPMWHNKYAIHRAWFGAHSPYSLYAHLPWQGYLLTILLDVPLVLNIFVATILAIVVHMTRPIWESLLALLLTSGLLWKQWPHWFRFAHAALPFKLLMGQMAWKSVGMVFGKVAHQIREYLITMEGQIWEASIPITVVDAGDEAIVAQKTGFRSSNDEEADEDMDDDEDDMDDDGSEEEDEEINLDDDDESDDGSDFEMITKFGGEEKRYVF